VISGATANLLRMLTYANARIAGLRVERQAHDANVTTKVNALEAQLLQFLKEQASSCGTAAQAAYEGGYAEGIAAGAQALMLRLTTIKDSRLVVTDVATGKPIRIMPPMSRFVALVTMGRFVGDSGVSVELIQELLPSDPYIEIVAPKNGSKPDGT